MPAIAAVRGTLLREGGGGHLIRWAVALAGAGAAALCLAGQIATNLSPAARSSLAVTAIAVGLWASELAPLPVTAVLAMVLLVITHATPTQELAFSGFASPILFFLLGSAGIGIAAEQSRLADRMAAWLLKRSKGSGPRLLGELLISLPIQALAIPSAISRNAVLVPVYDRVLHRLGRPPRLSASVMLSLGVIGPLASSALLTGGTSPVAASQALGGFTWLTWLVALAPPYYLLILIDALAVWWFGRPERLPAAGVDVSVDERSRWTRAERTVAAVSVATSLLWIADAITRWPPAIPALLALVVLMLPRIGVMSWQTFAARAPWSTCFVLAAAVSLAGALNRTGAAGWMARGLFGHLGGGRSVAWMAIAVFLVTALITLAIPNRAAAITLCIPLATAFAATGALSVPAAGLIVMMAVDAETIYPAQTAANLLAYDTGLFSSGQLARFNAITLAVAAAVAVLSVSWWSFIGLPGAH